MTTEQVEIDELTKRVIIQSLSEKLAANYIFPDVAQQINIGLQRHLEAGDYAEITEGDLFALALTMHLQEVNRDEHLWVRWHPESLPDSTESLRQNPQWQEERMAEARLDNFGLHKLERLPGNIGYLDIRYLHRAAWGGDTLVAAMGFLQNVSALIIDLRKCTGGYPGMICLASSYFFGEDPIHIGSIYWHDEQMTQQYWTLPHVPGKHLDQIPVYVLTSKVTFSGGEEFASILQRQKRAIVLGDKTDGGTHPGASYRLHTHFEVFIPIGRAIHPLSGESLEGAGVLPDFSVPQEHAYLAAYHLALRRVLASLGEFPAGPYLQLAQEIQNTLNHLTTSQKFCPKCGYQNPLYRVNCKHCDALLIDTTG